MTTTNLPATHLDADQLAEIERTLQAMLKERVAPASGDAVDVARHRAHGRALEAALARIGDGTFGRCRWCGGPVPAARLEVVPTAQGCQACTARRWGEQA